MKEDSNLKVRPSDVTIFSDKSSCGSSLRLSFVVISPPEAESSGNGVELRWQALELCDDHT